MSRRRVAAAAVPLLAAALSLTGCGNAGGLKSGGPTPSAVGPARLWPELKPARPDEESGLNEVTIEVVKGIDVPKADLHNVDPLDIIKAEAEAHPDTYTGPDALPEQTAKAIKACTGEADDKACPVLEAYYRDLTGNGKDELIVGIKFDGEEQGTIGIRVYSLDQGKLIRIMGMSQPVLSVELAGRDLIIRSPAHIPGYEYRDAWSWSADQHALLPQRMEIIRSLPSGSPTPKPAPSPVRPGSSPSAPAAKP
ncbi:hypothetical protein [Streptomyces sp. NBC_01304]|uniref:hypothetical protein n=1 Tax=Streptomyces sp. NBC_01304 TaxID=2903818 RepID=UPI002E0E852D|nr:hypothetical protein OG430_17485 [Streptomyces sp. NBC_01304]